LEYLFKIQHDLIFKQNVPSAEILTTGQSNNLLCAGWSLLPFSRGSVHIGSTDPLQTPVIDPKFFLIDYDMQVEIAISRLSRQFWSTPPAKGLTLSPLEPDNKTVPPHATDAQWRKYITSACEFGLSVVLGLCGGLSTANA
jgi:choline dehydrogenase